MLSTVHSFGTILQHNYFFDFRSVLEKKAKLYDSLSKSSSHDDSLDYLVDFAGKASKDKHFYAPDSPDDTEDRRRREKEEEEEEARRADSDEYDAPSDPEDDWYVLNTLINVFCQVSGTLLVAL